MSIEDGQIASLKQELLERDKQVASLEYELSRAMAERDRALADLGAMARDLQLIRQRPGFQALEVMRRLVQRVAPPGSMRSRPLALAINAASYLISAGPLEFTWHLLQPWTWGKPATGPSALARARACLVAYGWRGLLWRLVRPWLWAPHIIGRRAASHPFICVLDPAVPADLAVGRGTHLLVRAWCTNPHKRIRDIVLAVDGRELHTNVRHGAPALGFPVEAQTLPGSLFWSTVPIGPSDRERNLEIAVRLRWSDGRDDSIALGSVRLLPNVTEDIQPAVPIRQDPEASPLVCICMTTYNPPLHLFKRQVESIKSQTYKNWLCVIRDDCSDPSVFDSIQEEVEGDERFQIYRNATRLGFYHNFEACLTLVPAKAQFIALSDHDDCWHADKLETLLGGFDDKTMLVYSDMNIVDHDGKLLAPTYWTNRLNNYTNLTSLIIANTITGAASVFRREILDPGLPFPQRTRTDRWFHDHWLACVALALGKVNYIDRPLYDYVQHGANAAGHFAPKLEGIVRSIYRFLPSVVRRPGAVLDRWEIAYQYDVLRIQLLSRILLTRTDPNNGIVNLASKRRSIARLARLDHSMWNVGWLLLRGTPRAWKRTVTMGLEYDLVRGLLWLKFSQFTSLLSRGSPTDVLPLQVSPPAVVSGLDITRHDNVCREAVMSSDSGGRRRVGGVETTGVLVPRMPAGLYGHLAAPLAGDLISPGVISVEGWVAHVNQSLREVRVRCGDVEVGRSTVWQAPCQPGDLPVPDHLRSRVVSWTSTADLTKAGIGERRLDVEVRMGVDDWTLLDSVCIVLGSECDGFCALGRITSPAQGANVARSIVTLEGYAVHRDGPVQAVVINVNLVPVARVAVGLSSPAAWDRWPALPRSRSAGWRADIDLRIVKEPTADIAVEALMPNGAWSPLDEVRINLFG